MSKQDDIKQKIIPFPGTLERKSAAALLAIITLATLLAVYGTICCFRADRLYRAANASLATAQTLHEQASQVEAADKLVKYLSQLESHPIQWTEPDGQAELYYCYDTSVNGPYAPDEAQQWFTTINGDYDNYEIGSYDQVGDQWFYNHYKNSGNYDHLETCHLIQLGESVYKIRANYNRIGSSDAIPIRYYEEERPNFNINVYCIKGRNNYDPDSFVQVSYNDQGVINPAPVSPCGCVNCCCEVCTCNEQSS